MFLKGALPLLLALAPTLALAQRETTRGALARLEETLTVRVEDGTLKLHELTPAMVVSVAPAFEESRAHFPTAALAALVRVFGAAGLRSCEACLAPRLTVENGRMEQLTTNLGTADITRLDEATRGASAPARTAIWLDENPDGVSLRIIDLRNSRIVLAQNFDPQLAEAARTHTTVSLTRELQRRSKQESLTHTFIDVGILPHQHVSLDWLEQWGDTNCNLSGLTISFFDPVVGIGGAYFRVIPPLMNTMVGAKLLLSVPTALVRALGGSGDVIDPLLTGVLMVRWPIFSSNAAVIFSISTNVHVTFGLSLMNFSVIPFLP